MKRTERIGALIKILTDSPNKPFSLQYFCDHFGIAKSSVSEDIQAANLALMESGNGYLETISGAKGGVKFIPDITEDDIRELQQNLVERLSDYSRLLGGNFIYTSDVFYDPSMVKPIATIFAKKFRNCGADYVITIETKGIPLAFSVANLLGLPLVVVRREAKISEGSTVSINYFSGSDDRLQKMSMSKRAIVPGSKLLIIDDFMRGGGSIIGISEMVKEFNSEVVGVGVAIVSEKPEKKKIDNYCSIVRLGNISLDDKTIEVLPSNDIF